MNNTRFKIGQIVDFGASSSLIGETITSLNPKKHTRPYKPIGVITNISKDSIIHILCFDTNKTYRTGANSFNGKDIKIISDKANPAIQALFLNKDTIELSKNHNNN